MREMLGRLGLVALGAAVLVSVALPAWAQEDESAPVAAAGKTNKAGTKKAAGGTEADDGKDKENPYGPPTKVRTGSMLHRTAPPDPVPDLRGEYERRRDLEVVRHFRRLAELDAIAELASQAGDSNLVAEVDTVRRAEQERFRLAMYRLRLLIQAKRQSGLP